MTDETLLTELSEARQQITSLQEELDQTNKGTMALTVELEESRETLARQARQLKRTNAELEALNAELNAFSYSVSHDLRAPLRSIIGFSGMLAEDYGDTLGDDSRAVLSRVRTAAQRMDELISDLLQLSRASRTELDCTELDLSSIATQVTDRLREAQPERRVEVRVRPGMSCRGDPRLLRIVMENLIGNAWKFTAVVDHPVIDVGMSGEQNGGPFYVCDNGAGFDMQYVDRLFTPFQRLHTEEEFPGNGVGLATVQRIIRRHGGRIWAEAEFRKGACFFFTIGGEASSPRTDGTEARP